MRKDLHEIEWLDCKIESVVNEANKQTDYIRPFYESRCT